jgi:hypothetical protein
MTGRIGLDYFGQEYRQVMNAVRSIGFLKFLDQLRRYGSLRKDTLLITIVLQMDSHIKSQSGGQKLGRFVLFF